MSVSPIMDWPAEDRSSPFYCHGPTLISFSGGRTSAFMLWAVVCAHGGVLPEYVYVVFANTGKEREETLRFVHNVGLWLGVHIWWVEWRPPPAQRVKATKCPHQKRGRCDACKAEQLMAQARTRFEVVGLNSCDREGIWFAALIRRKQALPNVDMRYCTEKLKVETMKWFMVSMGLSSWFNMVGLRADEPGRVLKQFARNQEGKERWVSGCPLFVAGVVKRIVMEFWLGRNQDPRNLTHPLPQGFDLGLRDHEGNCDLCFLKGRGKKAAILRDASWIAVWWAAQERDAVGSGTISSTVAAQFDKRETVTALAYAVERSPELIDFEEGADQEVDCTGVTCMADTDPIADTDVGDDAVVWLRDYMAKLAKNPPSPRVRNMAAPAVRDLFAEFEAEAA